MSPLLRRAVVTARAVCCCVVLCCASNPHGLRDPCQVHKLAQCSMVCDAFAPTRGLALPLKSNALSHPQSPRLHKSVLAGLGAARIRAHASAVKNPRVPGKLSMSAMSVLQTWSTSAWPHGRPRGGARTYRSKVGREKSAARAAPHGVATTWSSQQTAYKGCSSPVCSA